MGAGILPIALYRGSVYILLGLERGKEKNKNLWCDFGGRPNKNETHVQTAIREGVEELNGFLGTEKQLKEQLETNKITQLSYEGYTTILLKIKYNNELPYYFNNSNKFAEQHLHDLVDDYKNGLFEKTQIKWLKLSEFKSQELKETVREHYRPLLQ